MLVDPELVDFLISTLNQVNVSLFNMIICLMYFMSYFKLATDWLFI